MEGIRADDAAVSTGLAMGSDRLKRSVTTSKPGASRRRALFYPCERENNEPGYAGKDDGPGNNVGAPPEAAHGQR